MLNPSNIIALISEDAPCVSDILRESYFEEIGDGSAPPTDEELLEQLEKYGGNNHEVHYWAWRYAQMKEDDATNNEIIRLPFTENDAESIRDGDHFLWNFWGRQIFIFNTDTHPVFDPDSESFDPDEELPI